MDRQDPATHKLADLEAEIGAMRAVATALDSLADDAQRRVVVWAASRYAATLPGTHDGPKAPSQAAASTDMSPESHGGSGSTRAFGTLAELVNAAQPRTGEERALVAAYWLQVHRATSSLTGLAVNNELRLLGYTTVKIATAMSGLQHRRPALVLQLRKSGRTQQARKTYKVTNEGVVVVEAAIKRGGFLTES